MIAPPPPPATKPGLAFLGYGKWPRGGVAVRVCSWCPDAATVTAWAAPLPVTHGICPECYQRVMLREASHEGDAP